MDLYTYKKGNWKNLQHWNKQIIMVQFFNPDSFIFIAKKNLLYKYGKTGPHVIDALGSGLIILMKGMFFIWQTNGYGAINTQKKRKLLK